MDVRERLKKLIDEGQQCPADRDPFGDDCENCKYFSSNNCFLDRLADHLIANGVTITPAVPGPSDADSNIMELCFKNGERHMKEKVITMLQDVLDQAGGYCVIDVSGVIKAVEDL